MPIEWANLSEDERTALKRMNRGPYPNLDSQLAERLISLGLAVESRAASVSAAKDGNRSSTRCSPPGR